MADYPQGIFFNAPHQNAPSFVKGQINIKIEETINWLNKQLREGKISVQLDAKENRDGKYYLSVNDYQHNKHQGQNQNKQSHLSNGTGFSDFDGVDTEDPFS